MTTATGKKPQIDLYEGSSSSQNFSVQNKIGDMHSRQVTYLGSGCSAAPLAKADLKGMAKTFAAGVGGGVLGGAAAVWAHEMVSQRVGDKISIATPEAVQAAEKVHLKAESALRYNDRVVQHYTCNPTEKSATKLEQARQLVGERTAESLRHKPFSDAHQVKQLLRINPRVAGGLLGAAATIIAAALLSKEDEEKEATEKVDEK